MVPAGSSIGTAPIHGGQGGAPDVGALGLSAGHLAARRASLVAASEGGGA